jgi:hypothetical protein
MRYPIPAVRVRIDGREILARLEGGQTWEGAARSIAKELGAKGQEPIFIGPGEPFEKDGGWWLPLDFSIKD